MFLMSLELWPPLSAAGASGTFASPVSCVSSACTSLASGCQGRHLALALDVFIGEQWPFILITWYGGACVVTSLRTLALRLSGLWPFANRSPLRMIQCGCACRRLLLTRRRLRVVSSVSRIESYPLGKRLKASSRLFVKTTHEQEE